ncbi:unnamed protein product [Microthlaspi erraticum]|uniref:Uncharacterized protein n=1 Tax=Microthlaspi erraticum TaxID=1685480 RepID=A0A6D2K4W2_9BRAS|nr:unnamed protein product [Microthlaspi erraticum]
MGLIHSLVWIICFLRFSSQFDVSVFNESDSLSPSNKRTIVSAGGVFELVRSYVWVANRDEPLNNYNRTLEISEAKQHSLSGTHLITGSCGQAQVLVQGLRWQSCSVTETLC